MLIPSATVKFPLLRQMEIFRVALQLLIFLLWDRFTGNVSSAHRHRRARWLIQHLLALGPTFIKIGQSLSTRADLIPLEYIEELAHLQDRVPPFSSREAIAVIEAELGQSVDTLFKEFQSQPLASASLGQVHQALLPSGEEVVVKVQRLGLRNLFNLDFYAIHQLIFIGNFLPLFKKYKLEAIYQEFAELLFREIDYINEGKNAERFRENFKNHPNVKVPLVYWDYTTSKVLTLEYLPGIKVDDRSSLEAQGINLDKVIETGICSYLKQLLEDGFFQSDPHPGNMAVGKEGELIFYDFGTMTEVPALNRETMLKTFFAVLKKDSEEVLQTMMTMGLIEEVRDMQPVRRIINFLLDEFRDKPIDIKAFDRLSEEIYSMFRQQPFRLPPQMMFILKSVTTLDGIARALDPQYNLLAASQPFVKSLVMTPEKGSMLGEIFKQVQGLVTQSLLRPSRNHKNWQTLLEKIATQEARQEQEARAQRIILNRIYLGVKSVLYSCLTGFSILIGILVQGTVYVYLSLVCFGLAGLFGLFLTQALLRLILQERIKI
jgi:predicted unusual protein kinase regulating ubiquinone biosynthesis (AarF/ABC1/UbiB family)